MPSAVTQNIAVVAASQSPSQLTQLSTAAQREVVASSSGVQAVQAAQRVSRAASNNLSARERQSSTTPQESVVDGTFRAQPEEGAIEERPDESARKSRPFLAIA